MLCPQCHIPILNDRCPNCGFRSASPKRVPEGEPLEPAQQAISFEILSQQDSGAEEEVTDWKGELRRRLDARNGKTTAKPPVRRVQFQPPSDSRVEETDLGDEIEADENPALGPRDEEPSFLSRKPLFDYRIQEATAKSTRLTNPILPREEAESERTPSKVLDQPLARESAQADKESSGSKGSRKTPTEVDFDPFLPLRLPAVEKADPVEALFGPEVDLAELAPKRVTRDILSSRLLAGVIDIIGPALMSAIFTMVAAWILNFELFSALTLKWWLVMWAALFYLNSVFFLVSCGQTPGMFHTELVLKNVEKASEEVPLAKVLVRVVFFVPIALTVAGLVWAVFDPNCRTLVDHLSGTDVARAEVD